MDLEPIDFTTALRLIWERSSYDRGYVSNPFSGPAGPELGLRRTRALLDALGAPDRRYPIVHVAGSKGKGSTCAYVSAIARAAGIRAGLYTSPHLHSFRERIAIDGTPVDEPAFANLTKTTMDVLVPLESARPELGAFTAFELLTAMALLAFAQQECALGVVEVGLGGTYDATNVIDPTVSVITRLDLEHTHVLGETIAEIAGNKAGIIKAGIPAITALQEPAALAVIKRVAATQSAPVFVAGRDFHWTGGWRDFGWSDRVREIAGLRTGMAGGHQMENAALAIAAWQQLGGTGLRAGENEIRIGVRAASLPGRFERVSVDGQEWILDGAHTPVAATALANEVLAEFGRPAIAVVGFLRDKHPGAFLASFAPAVSRLFVTAPANPRAIPVDELLPIARTANSQITLSETLETSMQLARSSNDSSLPIVVTGSLTLVAEARTLLGLGRADLIPSERDSPGKLRSIPIG